MKIIAAARNAFFFVFLKRLCKINMTIPLIKTFEEIYPVFHRAKKSKRRKQKNQ